MSSPMVGKMVKFVVGTRESLYKLNKKLTEVEIYVDGESGTLYIVPKEDGEDETFYIVPKENEELKQDNELLKDIREPFENFI